MDKSCVAGNLKCSLLGFADLREYLLYTYVKECSAIDAYIVCRGTAAAKEKIQFSDTVVEILFEVTRASKVIIPLKRINQPECGTVPGNNACTLEFRTNGEPTTPSFDGDGGFDRCCKESPAVLERDSTNIFFWFAARQWA